MYAFYTHFSAPSIDTNAQCQKAVSLNGWRLHGRKEFMFARDKPVASGSHCDSCASCYYTHACLRSYSWLTTDSSTHAVAYTSIWQCNRGIDIYYCQERQFKGGNPLADSTPTIADCIWWWLSVRQSVVPAWHAGYCRSKLFSWWRLN